MTNPRVDTVLKAITAYNQRVEHHDEEKINFIHGTNSNALIYMGKTVKKITKEHDAFTEEKEAIVPNALIPTGKLRKDFGLYPVTGELSNGTFGGGKRKTALNYKYLSGMNPDYNGVPVVLGYASDFKQQEIKKNIASVFSKISKSNYIVSLKQLMMYATNLSIFYPKEAKAYAVECVDACHFFRATLIQEVPDNAETINRYFDKYVLRIQSILKKCIVPLDGSTFKDQIENPFPIVVCAASEKLQTDISTEILHEGSLDFKSVKILFTPQENIETLRKKLVSLSIGAIQIETLPPEPESEAVSTSTLQRFRRYFCEIKSEEKGEQREDDFKAFLDNTHEHNLLKFYIASWLRRKEIIDRRIVSYSSYEAGHYAYTQEDLSCYHDKDKISKIYQLLAHIDSLKKPKFERKEEQKTTLTSVTTTAPKQLTANDMFDFAFFNIEKAMREQKRDSSVTDLKIQDEKLYAVEFIREPEHPIVLFSAVSDLSLKEEKEQLQKAGNQGNTVSIERFLPKLLELQDQNKNRIFFIPLAESRGRKHWTGLIIQGNKAYFRDPKPEALFGVGGYDLKPLISSLSEYGITLQLSPKSFTGYQDFRDTDHCGYFMGAIFGELATSGTAPKETSSDERKITQTKPKAQDLTKEFSTVRQKLDASTSYKPIKDSDSIQTKRLGHQKVDDVRVTEMMEIGEEDERDSELTSYSTSSEKKSFIQTCKDEYRELKSWKKAAFWGGVILFGAAIITTAVLTGGIALGLAGAGIALAVSSSATGVGMGIFTGAAFSTQSFKDYYKEASWKKKVALGIVIGLLVLGIGFLTGGLALAGLTGIGIGYAFTTIATSSIVASASIGGGVAIAAPVAAATVTGCTTTCIQKKLGGVDNFHQDGPSSLSTPEEKARPTNSTPSVIPTLAARPM